MTYQSLILAASGKNDSAGIFRKCMFLVNPNVNLVEAAILTNNTAENIVIALNSEEYNIFKSFDFRYKTESNGIFKFTQILCIKKLLSI